jgi:curved DNA-binding protein CbpA
MTERVTIPDPYKVLQVDPEAEGEVIEAAYRRLARKYHPDVSPDPESQERMVRINRAWELLRDPERRAAVDRARARATSGSGTPGPVGTPASATSNSHPHGGHGPAAHRPGREGGRQGEAPGMGTAGDPAPGGAPAGTGRQSPRAEQVSRDWTSGRSTSGSTYTSEASLRSDGVVGPPPGNPWGSVLNFGRYSGWSLGEIARNDAEYLEWLDRMPIGRSYQQEIDTLLRRAGRRSSVAPDETGRRGIFRRR